MINFKVYLQFISVKTHWFHQKVLSLHYQIKCSLRHCRIKKGKETCSFPSRNPFSLYSFLFYWLSERYNIFESFAGVISCNQHLCLFLTLAQRRTPQKRGITVFGKLHQLADKLLLFRCRRNVMEYLVFFGTIDAYILCCAEIANLRIKVIEANVIG